jgi:hypothetical protein
MASNRYMLAHGQISGGLVTIKMRCVDNATHVVERARVDVGWLEILAQQPRPPKFTPYCVVCKMRYATPGSSRCEKCRNLPITS